jgi:hypothetical protein
VKLTIHYSQSYESISQTDIAFHFALTGADWESRSGLLRPAYWGRRRGDIILAARLLR